MIGGAVRLADASALRSAIPAVRDLPAGRDFQPIDAGAQPSKPRPDGVSVKMRHTVRGSLSAHRVQGSMGMRRLPQVR